MQTVLKKGEYVSIFLILDENRKKITHSGLSNLESASKYLKSQKNL